MKCNTDVLLGVLRVSELISYDDLPLICELWHLRGAVFQIFDEMQQRCHFIDYMLPNFILISMQPYLESCGM